MGSLPWALVFRIGQVHGLAPGSLVWCAHGLLEQRVLSLLGGGCKGILYLFSGCDGQGQSVVFGRQWVAGHICLCLYIHSILGYA